MDPTKMQLQLQDEDDTSEVSQSVSTEVPPNSRCPICLDRFDNVVYVSCCLHKFCFRCIHEWSKIKAECPLCKQPFNSIYHSIKADDDFEELVLGPENGSPGRPEHYQFINTTTLTWFQQQALPLPDDVAIFENSQQRDVPFHHVRSITMTLRRMPQNESTAVNLMQYHIGLRVQNIQDDASYRDLTACFHGILICPPNLPPGPPCEVMLQYDWQMSPDNMEFHINRPRILNMFWRSNSFFLDSCYFLRKFISFVKLLFNMVACNQSCSIL